MADKGYDALSNYRRLNDLRINRVGMTRYCNIEYYETLEGDALRKWGDWLEPLAGGNGFTSGAPALSERSAA